MKLVLFDFDGTLTTKDSFLEFIKFTHGSARFWGGMLLLSPMLIAMKLGLVSNEYAKGKLLGLFYKGKSKDELQKLGNQFHTEFLSSILRPKGIEQVKSYQAEGQQVALVSASVDIWLQAFADQMSMQLLCTIANYDSNGFSGKFEGKNCIGPEKVDRIKKAFDLQKFDEIIAYGDTSGDREMLELADQAFFKPFRD